MKWSRAALTVLLAAALTSSASAQDSLRANPLVHWGKWGTAGISLAFHLIAISAHNRSDRTLSQLTLNCFETPVSCSVGSDGRYVDSQSEAMFQSVLHDNRKARAYLIGGEVALLGTVVLFVADLTRHKAHPPNQPFNPEISPGPNGTTHLGFRFSF
ncbi:MAG: hypothetical protein ABI765_09340 [Gemmatimonadota bacterium]